MRIIRKERILVLFGVQIVAIFLFLNGFLLSRYEIQTKSEKEPENKREIYQSKVPNSCFLERREEREERERGERERREKFEKAVVVVIDALRFDFLLQYSSSSEHWENNFETIQNILKEEPSHWYLAPFIADAPTTTMQRIKGLTTGGLPTFIEIKDNLASQTVTEDTWLSQLSSLGRSVFFLGDDTWVSLFPEAFDCAFPFPSFDVKDLDTVDNGVLCHLVPEMSQNIDLKLNNSYCQLTYDLSPSLDSPSSSSSSSSCHSLHPPSCSSTKEDNNTTTKPWSVIIAHFLGLDHVGHRYGPSHPAAHTKMHQLDTMLRDVLSVLDDDTLFVLMGDHGMTFDGNHGGASECETSAALFFYSSRGERREGEERNEKRGKGLISHSDPLGVVLWGEEGWKEKREDRERENENESGEWKRRGEERRGLFPKGTIRSKNGPWGWKEARQSREKERKNKRIKEEKSVKEEQRREGEERKREREIDGKSVTDVIGGKVLSGQIDWRQVDQIDIVPTISLLLDIPIPFSNLGKVIPDFFLGFYFDQEFEETLHELLELHNQKQGENEIQNWEEKIDPTGILDLLEGLESTTEALQKNIKQIFQYGEKYCQLFGGDFEKELLQMNEEISSFIPLFGQWRKEKKEEMREEMAEEKREEKNERVKNEREWKRECLPVILDDISSLSLLFYKQREFLSHFLEIARSSWTTFSLPLMTMGVLSLLLSLSFLFVEIVLVLQRERGRREGEKKWWWVFVIGVCIGFFAWGVTGDWETGLWGGSFSSMLSFLLFSLSFLLFSEQQHCDQHQNDHHHEQKQQILSKNVKYYWGGIMIMIIILRSLGLFSNSYIESEKTVSFFLLFTSSLVTCFFTSFLNSSSFSDSASFFSCKILKAILLSMTMNFALFLSEGVWKQERSDEFLLSLEIPSFFLTFVILSLSLLSLQSLSSPLSFSLCFHVGTWIVSSILVPSYWLLRQLHYSTSSRDSFILNFFVTNFQYLPLFVYLFALLSLSYYLCCSLFVFFSKFSKKESKKKSDEKTNGVMESQNPTMMGILFGHLFWVSELLGGPKIAPCLLCLLLSSLLVASIAKDLRQFLSSPPSSLPSSFSFAGCGDIWEGGMIAFLAVLFFYATGHEASFDSLQFDCAFVGFEKYNFYLGGIMLALNTWSSFILLFFSMFSLSPLSSLLERFSGGSSSSNSLPSTLLSFSSSSYIKSLSFLFFFSLSTTLTTIFVFLERRHLMVWRVFAPKLVFECAGLLVVNLLLCLFSLLSNLEKERKERKGE